MRRVLLWSLVATAGLALSAACGGGGDGGTGPGGGGGGDATFSAKIDGAAWTADASRIQILPGSTGVPGSLIVTATRVNGTQATSLQFILGFVKFQANYPLGVNYITTPGGTASVIEQSGAQSETRTTPLDGASGLLQITARTGNRVSGVFSFVAQPLLGQAVTGNRTVSEGTFEFDLPEGFTDVVAPNYGSDIMADLDGAHFYAATALCLGANGVFTFGGQTTQYSLQITNTTLVTTPTTLALGSGVRITLIDLGTGHSWGGISGDSGSVQFSGVSATRLNGVFGGRLQPNFQGGSPVVITSGFYNMRVDAP
ncbi:MAG TPA: hypothetical protein VG712_07990 [Gemmatimonadales bacterium]|nr:hypothetical protein [Gemmatimonadales bacterium]